MSGDLTHRLPLNGSGDELDRLSDNINQMIARIEQLMAGMKQVTSDIAHDLRTPLGRLRQKLELARDSECTGIECKAVFELTIAETDGILETFDALLRIGKIDAGAAVRRFAEVDLSEMTARLGESYRPVIEDNTQFLKTSIETGVRVTGDRELLMQMLVNLMENAIRHCNSGTLISLSLSQGDKAALLTIADNGCGVPAEELPKILRPFYRLEQSRSSVGSGLGLALVDAIARLHGVRLDLSDNGPGLKISLAFSNKPNAVLQP
jgi:signal transduction histidine kinase